MTTTTPLDSRTMRSIVALLASVLCSSIAGQAAFTALGKFVFDINGRELDLGWLGLAEFAPAALLVLVTGTVADRVDRRTVVSIALGLQTFTMLALAAYTRAAHPHIAPILAIVVATGITRAFIAPSVRSLPADVVPAEHLPALTAKFSATWQIALIGGPVLGGALYLWSPTAPFVAAAVLVAVASVTILAVERSDAREVRHGHATIAEEALLDAALEPTEGPLVTADRRGGVHEALEGLRFIRSRPILLGAISLDLFAVLFGGAFALLPAIADKRLHVGALGLGWLNAAAGIGAAIVTFTLAARPLRRHIGVTLLSVVALFGTFTIVLGVTHVYAIAFVAVMLLAGADAVSVFIRATLVPLVTPEDRRGRVLAVENVFIGASNELGAFESGVAGQWLGAGGAVVLGGIATLVVAGTWWFAFPDLRNVDEFPAAAS